MKITVERAESKTKREVWEANLSVEHSRDPTIVVTFWGEQERPTSRHKWQSLRSWSMHTSRLNQNSVDEPPLPEDVEAEMRTQASAAMFKAPIKFSYR